MIPSSVCVLFLVHNAVTTHGVKTRDIVRAVMVQPDAVNILQRENSSQELPTGEELGQMLVETCGTKVLGSDRLTSWCRTGFCFKQRCYKGKKGKEGCSKNEDCEDACDTSNKTCIDCRNGTDCSTVRLHMTEGGQSYGTWCITANESNVAIEEKEKQRGSLDDQGLRCRIAKFPEGFKCGKAVTGRSRTDNNGGCKDGLICLSDNKCHRVLGVGEDCSGKFQSACGEGLECHAELGWTTNVIPREKIILSQKCLGVAGGLCYSNWQCVGDELFCCKYGSEGECRSINFVGECDCTHNWELVYYDGGMHQEPRGSEECPKETSFCSKDPENINEGKCRRKREKGVECERHEECKSNYCNKTAVCGKHSLY
mmetsp:Transcript_18771/g.34632  ORF Transcript_18771/g.34632 Transcript_18771/m.34632 type:complete len:370 (+) Transcript_18771:54-1163(+)